jgi:hypothetical protein
VQGTGEEEGGKLWSENFTICVEVENEFWFIHINCSQWDEYRIQPGLAIGSKSYKWDFLNQCTAQTSIHTHWQLRHLQILNKVGRLTIKHDWFIRLKK